jgi:hypothetical protein
MDLVQSIILISIIISIVSYIYFGSIKINKIIYQIKTLNNRTDVVYKTKGIFYCNLDNSGEINNSINIKEKMNIYFFDFGIAITTIKKPRLKNNDFLIYFYQHTKNKNKFNPTNYKGIISEMYVQQNNIIIFDAWMKSLSFTSFVFGNAKCKIEFDEPINYELIKLDYLNFKPSIH